MQMNLSRKKKKGISRQLFFLILIGIVIAGVLTYLVQYTISTRRIELSTGDRAADTAKEMISALKEYPAYEWLLSYWYENAEQLDVEYDIDFAGTTATEEKERIFTERHPDHSIHFLTREAVEALPDEDQKLYAEITYSLILARVNESKRNLGCNFLYLTATGADTSDQPYETQCFLMSGAEPGQVRGTAYEEIYPLGVTLPAGEDASESMRKAVEMATNSSPDSGTISGENLTSIGSYVDYYAYVDRIGDQVYLAGVTYNINNVISWIRVDAFKSTLLATLYQLLLLFLVMMWMNRFFIHPLKKILESIRTYTHSRDSAAAKREMDSILSEKRAVAVRENEIGQLAEDFTDLTTEIDTYVEEIRMVTSQQERYSAELNIAAKIQEQVLPKDFLADTGNHEFGLYASMTPAKEVGGDFYDFFFTDQNHLALVIGDVSDKGVPAALFMMAAKTLIGNLARMENSPARIMSLVNDQLCENNQSGYFVTVWLAMIDLRTGEGTAVNAGHENPAVCRAGSLYELVSDKHSIAIGVMPGVTFPQHAFRMNPGDQLFVYTDGVPEAVNNEDEQFGTNRMLEVLNRNRDTRPEILLGRMKEEIDAFAGEVPQFDDTTMMCFQYKGEE